MYDGAIPKVQSNHAICERIITHLNIFKTVLLANAPQDIFLAALLHFPGKKQLIQDEVCLLKVEYDVEFTDIAVIFIHLLDITVHDLEANQLVVGSRAAGDKKERGITTVNYFLVWLTKGAVSFSC